MKRHAGASRSAGEARARTVQEGAPTVQQGAPRAARANGHMAGDPLAAALTRLELGVVRAQEALASWGIELHKQVAAEQLSWHELSVLHCIRLRGEGATLAELLVFLHRHDLASLQYCLRKLEGHGLIRRSRGASRREICFSLTEKGRQVTDAYADMRQSVLVALCRELLDMPRILTEAAGALERMIAIYDQATQTILNQRLTAQLPAPPRPAAPRPKPGER